MQRDVTAWPKGAIARYLTAGGATVDLTETGPREGSKGLHETVAACTGCPAADGTQWEDGFYDYGSRFHPLPREEAIERAEAAAREWAQKHAESCRAMPKPGAA
ncbi:hypothetical protein ACFWMG_04890 [Streptomyces sp. NPDC127074]|uniref:hypothetical protein n=1 Tax=Streptomyces sp. NPDC127074 TaxID=3347130 RepID=UPI00364F72C3